MIDKIKIFYKNNTIWIFLASRILFSIVLAVGVILIDTKFVPVLDYIPTIFLTSIGLAKTILSTLVGALLAMTTFTFSTITVVLTMYSSEFSPRAVNNFLKDKTTMRVLGIFVGGFFYCILALFFMRKSFSEYLVLSATIGVIYSLLCVIYFVVFVYKVVQFIQVSKLIGRLYDESYEVIETALKYRKNQVSVEDYEAGLFKSSRELITDRVGYLEHVEFEGILYALDGIKAKLVLNVDIGDFIFENQVIATFYYDDDMIDNPLDDVIDNQLMDRISKHFSIEKERMAYNDYRFSLQKIVDITLRSIPPGVNDPNTAIYCINILGVLFSKLGEIKGRYTVIKNEGSLAEVIYQDFNFKDDLYFTFYQIVHYGKEDISVMLALLNALQVISRSSTDDKREDIEEFADYIYQNSISNFTHKLDLEIFQKAKNAI